jgi:hypothetical protein
VLSAQSVERLLRGVNVHTQPILKGRGRADVHLFHLMLNINNSNYTGTFTASRHLHYNSPFRDNLCKSLEAAFLAL